MRGKKLATLEEIQYFYVHHDEILKETPAIVAREQEEIIFNLTNDESRLTFHLQEVIIQKTAEVDTGIRELNQKSSSEMGFITRVSFRLRYWIAVALRDHHIHSPCSGLSRELSAVSNRKNHHINNKQSLICQECLNITRSYEFLKANESFLIGAEAEEEVIRVLSHLPDDFHVLNDVNLRFHRAIYWRKKNEYIRTCQIDHIVAGPTGIFLLETKNWKTSDLEQKSGKILHQVKRANLALWYYTKDYYFGKSDRPKIHGVVVSMRGSKRCRNLDQYTDVISPNEISNYVLNRPEILSEESINKFVKIISRD
ncbi:nuclease-related domain-containing protein [uncultured Methanoregula sp.]|uniref:nuclease-related domain-containing protein n=1 Tax=uncultured Methanoregula sp. TaxID=1005933 RepID=UPI002AAA6375|nr:nuclease-related domain-containing protein [uncultured Methanoregula sp.]